MRCYEIRRDWVICCQGGGCTGWVVIFPSLRVDADDPAKLDLAVVSQLQLRHKRGSGEQGVDQVFNGAGFVELQAVD